ncbi:MAG: sigma-70 family RNA polymerase sigma factor [Bacteroidales bacterium]|nr:sigma-70 family RNA polymerase sigma factor [Bacteroidales bacterium]
MVEHQQDNIYISKVLEGDRNAFAYLVDKYKTMVYSLALRLVKDREEAEEISQDSFIKAYQSLASFKGKAKFSSWLYRIVYNTAISKLRQQPAGRVSLDESNIADTLYIENKQNYDALSAGERKKYLEKALDSLDMDEKMLVILYYYEERDLDEIATIAGLTKTNTKVKLYRARKKMLIVLKSYLKEETYNLL